MLLNRSCSRIHAEAGANICCEDQCAVTCRSDRHRGRGGSIKIVFACNVFGLGDKSPDEALRVCRPVGVTWKLFVVHPSEGVCTQKRTGVGSKPQHVAMSPHGAATGHSCVVQERLYYKQGCWRAC